VEDARDELIASGTARLSSGDRGSGTQDELSAEFLQLPHQAALLPRFSITHQLRLDPLQNPLAALKDGAHPAQGGDVAARITLNRD